MQAEQKALAIAPDPESAPNEILKQLFKTKCIEQSLTAKVKEHSIELMNILNARVIRRDKLQKVAFNGIPDEIKGLRPVVWRILLNHLPLETEKWDDHLKQCKSTYDMWRQELIIQPDIKKEEEAQAQKKIMDHPLSVNSNSKWSQFFKDQDIWDEIEKDVKRTRTDMSFFYKAVDESQNMHLERLLKQAEQKKAELSLEDRKNYIETHADVLARVLFIYAKLNPGIKYVQGMNEVLAVIYYCFWCFGDQAVISNEYLESDLFFCFNNLMIEIRDGFLRDLDKEHTGITGKIKTFSEILKVVDPQVYRNLEDQNVNHQFYALRWVMLLMCQEFDMCNVIRLWDTLFSDPDRFDFLNYVCVAVVELKRAEALDGDFATCMESLQKATDNVSDVRNLLNAANLICARYIQIKQREEEWEFTNYKYSLNEYHV